MLKPAPPVRLAVIGAGTMGTNHALVASQLPSLDVVAIVDGHETKRSALAATVGAAHAPSIEALLTDPSIAGGIDAAVVATPTSTHHAVARACIEAGIHVLIEKPVASTCGEGEDLARRAAAAAVVLMVGHVERFNPAFRALVRVVDQPIHLEFIRNGPFRTHIVDNVVVDLMIHDLDLARVLAGSEVVNVSAVPQSAYSSGSDVAVALLTFENGVTASLTASRIGPEKRRRVTVTQADAVVAADLIRQHVTIDRTPGFGHGSDQGAMTEIVLFERRGEPLTDELRAFVDAIRGGPITVAAADGIAALELATKVLRAHGRSK